MSKARVSDLCGGEESTSAPYSTRREKSRKLAQKRRDTYKQIMEDLTSVLPFPREAVSQLDYNSRLRLALCFFRLKTMVEGSGEMAGGGGTSETQQGVAADNGKQIVKRKFVPDMKPALFQPGMLQDLMSEALDGFLMVTQVDGTIVFLSESIHKHMGLFQSEHIGVNMFELIHEEDHADVRKKIEEAEMKSLNQKGAAKVIFFCRMKCSRYKVANVITKSPGYKLVYISGTIKRARGEPFIACVVRPVSPPSVLEIRLEGNMFVCRYGVDFTCTYFDGRLRPLLGYDKDDLIGKQPFDLFHHDDIAAIVKCRNKVFEKGESLSGYYRFFNAHGESIWLQTRATLIIDSRTGKPICVNCMFFVISKEDGDKDLQSRLAIKAAESSIKDESVHSHDPFPVVERSDGTIVNPLHDEDNNSSLPSPPTTSEESPSTTTGEISGKESPTSSYSPPAEAQSSTSPNGATSSESSEFSPGFSPVVISSSGLCLSSTSDLHSISSVGSGGSAQGSYQVQHHGSTTSVNSGTISSGDSVFTDRSSPQELTSTTTSRSKSTSPDSCVPDSTTMSASTPVALTDKMVRTESGDLGYKSGSNSSLSLRDRLTSGVSCGPSPMTRTDSNASSIISNNPLSASSSAGSLQSHGSIGSATGSELHSHSTFHQGSSLGSNNILSANSSYPPFTTTDQYNNIHFVQNQPISTTNSTAFPLMHQQQMGSQFMATTQPGAGQVIMGNGAQQQFIQQSSLPMNGVGIDPINSLPDWTPAPAVSDFNASSSTLTIMSNSVGVGGISPLQPGGNPMFNLQTTGGPGFEYITPSVSGIGLPQEIYNPPPIASCGSNNMYNGSAPGHSSNAIAGSFQQPLPVKNAPAFTTTYNGGNHSATVASSSDLPLLTGDDLKILDTFDQVGGGTQFNGGNSQMVYHNQQTAMNGHSGMMI